MATLTEPASLPGEQLRRGQLLWLIVVLGSLIAIGPLTIDMYLPALPAIAADLRTTPAAVQLTITGTMAGMALGQLLIGPLSDAYGRRLPLIVGLSVHVAASLLCLIAPNLPVLGILRVLQGIGVAATVVVATAVLRDLFTGAAFARLLSRLLLVMGAAPILAPSLGGALLQWTDWRGVFATLAGMGLLLVAIASFGLAETLPPERRVPPRPASTLRAYRTLLRDRTFMTFVVVVGFAMGALMAYVAGSSFVFQEQYGLTELQFGVAFGAGAVSLIGATQANVRLLRYFSPQQILTAALAGGAVAAVGLLAVAASGLGGLPGLLVPLWLVFAAAGLVLPNAPALAMSRYGERAGTAAAVLGAGQFGLGAAAAPLVGLLGEDSLAMAAVISGCLLAAAAVGLLSTLLATRAGRRAPTAALAPAAQT